MSRFTIPAALVFLLSACTAGVETVEPTAPVAQVDATQSNPPAEDAVELPPLPADKPAAPAIRLVDLVGADEDEVIALIGEPDLRQDRAPAIAWIYDNGGCRFSLLLYPDLETNRRIVLSFETEGDACSARVATP